MLYVTSHIADMVGVTLSVLLSAGIKSRGAFRKRACRLIECVGTGSKIFCINTKTHL